MTAIREASQFIYVRCNAGSDGVQMDVPHQFEKVRFLLAQDRLISVLEEVARTNVTPVIGDCISCEEFLHHATYRC